MALRQTAGIAKFVAREAGAIPRIVTDSDQPAKLVTASAASPTVMTTKEPHAYKKGDVITVAGMTGTGAAAINGTRTVLTRTGETTFTVAVDLQGGGASGGTAQLVTPRRELLVVFPLADRAGPPKRQMDRVVGELRRVFGYHRITLKFIGTPND